MQIDGRRSQRADHVGSKEPYTNHMEVCLNIFSHSSHKSSANWKTKSNVYPCLARKHTGKTHTHHTHTQTHTHHTHTHTHTHSTCFVMFCVCSIAGENRTVEQWRFKGALFLHSKLSLDLLAAWKTQRAQTRFGDAFARRIFPFDVWDKVKHSKTIQTPGDMRLPFSFWSWVKIFEHNRRFEFEKMIKASFWIESPRPMESPRLLVHLSFFP